MYVVGSWKNDVFVVAEPGELAEKFLEKVKYSFQSMLKGGRRRYMSDISNISCVADLVACRPYFQIGVVVHQYIGRQTQVSLIPYPIKHHKTKHSVCGTQSHVSKDMNALPKLVI